MSLVVDASVALQWLLEDEQGREYSLAVLASLSEKRATVPALWLYEVGNGLLMACRRKRISEGDLAAFASRLPGLPVDVEPVNRSEAFGLPLLAHKHQLTSYDAAYLAVALSKGLPLATQDTSLVRAASALGVKVFSV